jgi:hypothetical protein
MNRNPTPWSSSTIVVLTVLFGPITGGILADWNLRALGSPKRPGVGIAVAVLTFLVYVGYFGILSGLSPSYWLLFPHLALLKDAVFMSVVGIPLVPLVLAVYLAVMALVIHLRLRNTQTKMLALPVRTLSSAYLAGGVVTIATGALLLGVVAWIHSPALCLPPFLILTRIICIG